MCSSDYEIGSTISSDGANEDHDDDGVTMVMIKCLDLEKKKEKNKKLKEKVKFDRSFLVWWLKHLANVITFRIDGHTIKMGALIGQLNHLVPLGVEKHAYAF